MSPAAPFDVLAARYDQLWTEATAGTLQRKAVWRALEGRFLPGERVADLGCGTGADAVWLAQQGVEVYALDSSPAMLAAAANRARASQMEHRITCVAGDIACLRLPGLFDGALSDFGALNMLPNLRWLACALAAHVRPGGHVALCFMGRFCLWETAWYSLRGQPRRALRRTRGNAVSSLGCTVYYHSARDVISAFSPSFRLVVRRGIGVFVPPSYLEGVARSLPRALAFLDRHLAGLPLLRGKGDHELLIFARR